MAGRPLSPEAQRIRDYLRSVRERGAAVPARLLARDLQVAHRRAHDILDYLVRRGDAVVESRARICYSKKPVCFYSAPAERAALPMFDLLRAGIVRR